MVSVGGSSLMKLQTPFPMDLNDCMETPRRSDLTPERDIVQFPLYHSPTLSIPLDYDGCNLRCSTGSCYGEENKLPTLRSP